jgi:hypothetical protein
MRPRFVRGRFFRSAVQLDAVEVARNRRCRICPSYAANFAEPRSRRLGGPIAKRNTSFFDDEDAVGERDGFGNVVRDRSKSRRQSLGRQTNQKPWSEDQGFDFGLRCTRRRAQGTGHGPLNFQLARAMTVSVRRLLNLMFSVNPLGVAELGAALSPNT